MQLEQSVSKVFSVCYLDSEGVNYVASDEDGKIMCWTTKSSVCEWVFRNISVRDIVRLNLKIVYIPRNNFVMTFLIPFQLFKFSLAKSPVFGISIDKSDVAWLFSKGSLVFLTRGPSQ